MPTPIIGALNLMQVRRFDDKDIKTLSKWYASRDAASPELGGMIPEIGFIVDDLAAGFLDITTSGLAILEGFIASKDSNKEDRSKALDMITEALIEEAQKRNAYAIVAFTKVKSIGDRAMKHNLKYTGDYKMFSKVNLERFK